MGGSADKYPADNLFPASLDQVGFVAARARNFHLAPSSPLKHAGTDRREVLVTNMLDAEPDHRYKLPGPSVSPLALATGVGVTFGVVIFTPWGISIGAVLCLLALIGWFWSEHKPKENLLGQTEEEELDEEEE